MFRCLSVYSLQNLALCESRVLPESGVRAGLVNFSLPIIFHSVKVQDLLTPSSLHLPSNGFVWDPICILQSLPHFLFRGGRAGAAWVGCMTAPKKGTPGPALCLWKEECSCCEGVSGRGAAVVGSQQLTNAVVRGRPKMRPRCRQAEQCSCLLG